MRPDYRSNDEPTAAALANPGNDGMDIPGGLYDDPLRPGPVSEHTAALIRAAWARDMAHGHDQWSRPEACAMCKAGVA